MSMKTETIENTVLRSKGFRLKTDRFYLQPSAYSPAFMSEISSAAISYLPKGGIR